MKRIIDRQSLQSRWLIAKSPAANLALKELRPQPVASFPAYTGDAICARAL